MPCMSSCFRTHLVTSGCGPSSKVKCTLGDRPFDQSVPGQTLETKGWIHLGI